MSCINLDSIPRPGVVALCLAAVCFSANATLAKLLTSTSHYTSFQVLYVRGLITLVGTSGVLMKNLKPPLPAESATSLVPVGWAVGRGIAGSIAIGSLYYGIALLPLTEGSVLYSLNPLFVALFSRLILREAVSLLRWVAVGFFLAGAFVSIGPEGNVSMVSGEGESKVWIGRGVMVLGAIAAATSVMCARSLSKFEKTHWAAQAWWQAICATSLAPLASFTSTFQVLQLGTDAPLFLAMGLCAFLGQLLIGYALQVEEAAVVGVLMNMDILFTIPWQIAVFGRIPKWYEGVGVALVFVAALVMVLDGLVSNGTLGSVDCCCCCQSQTSDVAAKTTATSSNSGGNQSASDQLDKHERGGEIFVLSSSADATGVAEGSSNQSPTTTTTAAEEEAGGGERGSGIVQFAAPFSDTEDETPKAGRGEGPRDEAFHNDDVQDMTEQDALVGIQSGRRDPLLARNPLTIKGA